jgi:hypothetical protein
MQVGLQLPSRLGPAALTQRDLIEMAVLADTTPGWDSLTDQPSPHRAATTDPEPICARTPSRRRCRPTAGLIVAR